MPPSLRLYMYQTRQQDLHSRAGTPYASSLSLVHVSNEAGKNYTRMQEPPMPPSSLLYMYQTRQQGLHSHAGIPYASFLTLLHVLNDTGKNYIRMQEPPMPPSLRLYMYQTIQERITFACRNPLCLHPYACTCIKRDRKK